MPTPNVGQLLAHPQIRAAIERALAAKGVRGDTILAHLDPREAAMLKLMGGVGTVNPKTGLRQFYDPDAGHADPTGSAGTHGGVGDIGAGGAGRTGDSGFGGLGDRISGTIDRIGNALGSNFGSGWASRGVLGGYGNASTDASSIGSGAGAGGGHAGQNYISEQFGVNPTGIAPRPTPLPTAPVISNMPQAPVTLNPMMSSTATTDLAGGERFGALPSWATQPYQVGTAPSAYPTPGVNAGLGAPGFAGNPLPGQPGGGLSAGGGGGLPGGGGGGLPGGGGVSAGVGTRQLSPTLGLSLLAYQRLTPQQKASWAAATGQSAPQPAASRLGPMMGVGSRPTAAPASKPAAKASVPAARPAVQPATMTAAVRAAAAAKAKAAAAAKAKARTTSGNQRW